MQLKPTTDDLAAHVRYLEERIRALRLSRKVLIDIIYSQMAHRDSCVAKLRAENRRLHKLNARSARAVMELNSRVLGLEGELARLSPQSGCSRSAVPPAGHSSSSYTSSFSWSMDQNCDHHSGGGQGLP
ncbi:MAG: hypothetical protein NUV93_07220 [Firmicutes bacterium]|nr:hypothetical protein [Bacillota bacterium]